MYFLFTFSPPISFSSSGSMSAERFDFVIIGAGAAGLQLALRFCADPWFSSHRILLLDPDPKMGNDRTWSFWEKGEGRWDHLVWKSWEKGQFRSDTFSTAFSLFPYCYKSLRSADFYAHAREALGACPFITWIKDAVTGVDKGSPAAVHTLSNGVIHADLIFDSRVEGDFFTANDRYSRVSQHFIGHVVETDSDVFDPGSFVMMDFRYRHRDQCSFMYVLPESSRRALVEFTFFSPHTVEDAVYLEMISRYMKEELVVGNWEVREVEKGNIPMSDYPFHKAGHDSLMKIGTAGGWVKPSTGYSFRNAERCIDRIVENLKGGRPPSAGVISSRHRLYDTLFLDLLQNRNAMGPSLFSRMYSRNSIQTIFRFLDEETSFAEDLRIMSTFDPRPFLKVILKKLTGLIRF